MFILLKFQKKKTQRDTVLAFPLMTVTVQTVAIKSADLEYRLVGLLLGPNSNAQNLQRWLYTQGIEVISWDL